MSVEKTQYLLEQINKLKNKQYEVALLTPLLVDTDLSDIQPYTSYPINSSSGIFYIDLYYEKLKVAIEIDELHHVQQEEEDLAREKEIIRLKGCTFKRIKISDIINIYEIIKDLKEHLKVKIKEQEDKGVFEKWIPKNYTMEQVKCEYPNAIFFKATKSSLSNSFDPTRGPLQIAQEKRQNASLFVTFSGNTVINVFDLKPNDWQQFEDKTKGFIQQGNEIPNHPLLSSGTTTEWPNTSNKIFGNNLDI